MSNNGIAYGIVDTARSLGMNPRDLATIISYETAGTFDPTKKGPTTQWGQHQGLIQFGKPQARQYGVDWNDPVNSQLGPDGAVAKYFRASGWKPGMNLLNAYSIVNAGAPGKFNASDAGNGGAPGTVRDKVENQMGDHMRKASQLLSAAFPRNGAAGNVGASGMAGAAGGEAPPSLADFAASRRKASSPDMPAPSASGQPQAAQQEAPPSLADFAASRRKASAPSASGQPSESGGFNPNPMAAPGISDAQHLGAGVARGLKDLPGGLAEIAGKVHESEGIRGMFDFIPVPDFVKDFKERNRKREGELIQSAKDWNAADEAEYQRLHGDSGWATGGRIGGNVATTFIPGTGQVKAAQGIGNLVKAGQYGKAVLGGAALGAAQSGVLSGGDPTQTAIGAVGGGLMPGLAKAVPMLSGNRAGGALTRASGMSPEDLAAGLRAGDTTLVAGAAPTAAQAITSNKGLSRLQKSMLQRDAAGATSQALDAQDLARAAELERVFGAGGQSADEIGAQIAAKATAGRDAAKAAAGAIYKNPELQATVAKPIGGARDVYSSAYTVMGRDIGGNAELRTIAEVMDSGTEGIPFNELQRVYSRTGEIAKQAAISGDQAASRVAAQLRAKMNEAMAGQPLFTEAKAAHAKVMQQYDTGWTGDLFRTGRDGMPRLSGAQVPNAALRGTPDGLERAQAFTRMFKDNPEGVDLLRQHAGDVVRGGGTTAPALDRSLSRYGAALGEIAPGSKALAADAARAGAVIKTGAASGSDTMQNIMTLAGLDKGFVRKLLDNGLVRSGSAIATKGASEGLLLLDRAAQSRFLTALDEAMSDPKKAAKVVDAYNQAMATRGAAAKTGLLAVPAMQGAIE